MRKQLIILFAITIVTFTYSQNKNQLVILNKFIAANNAGTNEAISQFIKETYEPNFYKKINIKKHINFYATISKEFGQLKPLVYKKTEEKPLKLIVYLIKENESILNKTINPAEILVVEMDLHEKNPKYLTYGLGLGALICELKKNQ
ncbi:MAG: hypothetical protein JKZ00_06215 [Flavobacteriaceae bacterium]|nr:hypothetical protein [Flavobacteriaceae bacterium]